MEILNETLFEEHIAECLKNSPLYNQRTSDNFSIESLCDKEMLGHFLKAQPAAWQMLTTSYPGEEVETVIKYYNQKLNHGDGLLHLLRKGITIKGKNIKFVQFKPVLEGPGTAAYDLYERNRFSVVRQMHYSLDEKDKGNELDLCILVNGLPLFTFELKNEGTRQNWTNGVYQYRYERDPQNKMLRTCLVHFVMDNSLVYMTTHLNGENTRFLPFNQDSINPPVAGDYPTSYMWRQILQADSILDLIEHFIKRIEDDGKQVVIFPRFHQLRAVRLLRSLAKEEGPGHNYLIQHSEGSGKTKSMAWLAHQLSNMTNPDGTPIYDCIIMVTDRIVLNRNMADDVVAFQTTAGTVKDIRRGSKNLADAINEGSRIIISTVQKFAFALKNLKREQSRKYAIIVDEAHTAIGNESAKDIVSALTTKEDIKALDDFNPEEYEDQMDALMAYMQVMRRQMSHISYFAFTATPKDKTYALFGKDGKAHDLYSMKQAIDEGFILDVLKYYQSHHTMFELIEKDIDDDQKKFFEEKKSLKVIYDSLNKNQYIMLRKANMMLNHFMHHTINKIGGTAKAMVVCDSRRAAADYKRLLDRLIADQYDGRIKTLVAFSGEVTDSQGNRCTEASMNDDGVYDDGIRIKFKEDNYKILIVAEKFQTGFDQPLLHTMYVDRVLGGIQCIQTLSRLNRCHPGKEDTFVMDFRNPIDNVQKSFQRYYTETTLDGQVDTQRIYQLKEDVEAYNLVNEDEIDWVVRQLQSKKTAVTVPSYLKAIVDDRIAPLEDDKKDVYRKLVDRYVRQYGFIAQFMDFTDPSLEKFYVFCKIFYKFLPYTKETLPIEILELIDLDKLRIQMQFEGQLTLEDEETHMSSSRIGEVGKKKPDELKSITEILDIANSPYKNFLNENDKILKQIWDAILTDPEVTDAFNAGNSFDALLNLVKDKFGEKISLEMDKYMNFAEVLEREKALSITLMRKFVEALAARTRRNSAFTYNEEALKEAIFDVMGAEFEDVCRTRRSFDEFVDALFVVLNTTSLPTLDGVDEMVKNALNNLLCNSELSQVDKRVYFSSLVSKYEAFLKKLYYLMNNTEVEAREAGSMATLADAIHAFSCLWNLRYDSSEVGVRYSQYLEMVRQWRNDEAHIAPNASDNEVRVAINIVVSMYLFVTGNCITELEMNGKF